jgi:hypothetical protein
MYAGILSTDRTIDPDEQVRLERLVEFASRDPVPEGISAGLLELETRLERVRRVPVPTWVYTALHMLGASLLKPLLKG